MAKKGKGKVITISLILLVGILMALVYLKSKNKPKGIAIKVEKAERRTIKETVSASGRIFPEKEVKISSDVSGEIVELFIAEGDSVQMGQVLAKINPDSYVSAVERGKASVSGAKAQLAISKSQKESSVAQKEQIASQLKNAERILERNKKLMADGIISQADYDLALANVENLRANLRAAEANIRSAEQSIKGNQYSIESAEASLKELQFSLSRTTITAPASGIISSLSVEQGERVVGTMQMTGTEMMRIANLNSMEVQVDVSENDIIKVSIGDRVEIEVDAYLDKVVEGTVTEIANSASNIGGIGSALNTDQVTNFIVKIRINPESYQDLIKPGMQYPFRPGMSASVDIFTNEVKDVITVPIQSVTAREEKDEDDKPKKEDTNKDQKEEDKEFKEVVFVYAADTVAMVEVKTGIQDDEYIEILSGIADSTEVVSGPYSAISDKLEDGKDVYIKEDEKKEDAESDE
ncbi:MAG: HlyD family efflux transporter periplasmic adaptor subunit [Saprospiraceae bacterium]|nr:efflux RND transporter periplasmic adaptor subunit [Bacteroidia bacterium]NNE13860.1 HlyD family efflux transporter periplasmic adaptor subunit [Saprospiraceae bacterium]